MSIKLWKKYFRKGWVNAPKVEIWREREKWSFEAQETENWPTACLLEVTIEKTTGPLSGMDPFELVIDQHDAAVIGEILLGYAKGVGKINEATIRGYTQCQVHDRPIERKLSKELMTLTGSKHPTEAMQIAIDRLEKMGS